MTTPTSTIQLSHQNPILPSEIMDTISSDYIRRISHTNSISQPSARKHPNFTASQELLLSSTRQAAQFLSSITRNPASDVARRVANLEIKIDNSEQNVDSNFRVQILNHLLVPEVFPNATEFLLGDITDVDHSKRVLLKGLRIPVAFFRQLSECSFCNLVVPRDIVTSAMTYVKSYLAHYVESYESYEFPYFRFEPHCPLKKLALTPDYDQQFYDFITNASDPIAETRYHDLKDLTLTNYKPLWHTCFITTVLQRLGQNVRYLTLHIVHGTGTFEDLATWEPVFIISPFLTDPPKLKRVKIKVPSDERLIRLLFNITILFIRRKIDVVLSGLWTSRKVILNNMVRG